MNLIWFRNDLRIHANPAIEQAIASGSPSVAVICLTPKSWDEHAEGVRRMGLWRARLMELQQELARLNIPLKVLSVGHFNACPDALLKLMQELQAQVLLFNEEYPLNEQRRDRSVAQLLESKGLGCKRFHAELIIPPGEVRTGQGTYFKVFTPFARAWRRQLHRFDRPIQAINRPLPETGIHSDKVPEDLDWRALQYDSALWPVESEAIRARVYDFVQQGEVSYAQQRDFPAKEGTSKLSPYLTIGAVSPLQLLQVLRHEYQDERWLEGSWLNELIWREFYRHLLVASPELSRLEPFRPQTEARIEWLDNPQAFDAWSRGETGFPIVDAAMQQLLQTGWMHNRLRMIVASFLTKLLGVDWRQGERFFMQHLIDADFASNLGGWQWSASTGADAAPYFRIFNPTAQSQRFDPDGEFLLRWLPELANLSPKERHLPGAGREFGRPAPIIDYPNARNRALESYNRT